GGPARLPPARGSADRAVHMARDRARAAERDACYSRRGAEGVDHILAAVDEVDDAGREARLGDELEDPPLREGDLLARLEDEGVPRRDGVGQKPERDHRREIERGDRGGDADRLTGRQAVDTAGPVGQALAHHQRRDPGRVLDVLDAPAKVVPGLRERLAVLARADRGDLLLVLFEEGLPLEEETGTLDGRRSAPGGERRVGRLDGGV